MPPDASFLLSADHVTVRHQGRAILESVSMQVAPGDFVTIVGPNGAGKTTLLKVLMGLVPVDGGIIRRRPGVKIGYMPQRLHADSLLPITVARFLRLKRGANAATIAAVALQAGITSLAQRQLSALSGGEMQRVMLAYALLGQPDVLILDEPVQNLDVAGQLAFYELLERLHRETGLAILMVSHDLHMVMARTRHVICLYHHVCCHGEPGLVSRDPRFVALFGDDMARLLGVYHHTHDHAHDHDAGAAEKYSSASFYTHRT
jgi:zinc transport system ATP-binding protein